MKSFLFLIALSVFSAVVRGSDHKPECKSRPSESSTSTSTTISTSTSTSISTSTSTTTTTQSQSQSPIPSQSPSPSQGQNQGGYMQKSKGNATFTAYTGCSEPACGKVSHGYTAAINQLAFGAPGGGGAGDACGRCFRLTGTEDPYTPSFEGPFKSVVLKVTDLCPYAENEDWCGQSLSKPLNQFGAAVHFDLCQDSDADKAFFPAGRGALSGHYEEVSCSEWSGYDGPQLWNGACLAGESAQLWPMTACGNTGNPPV